MSVVTAFIWFYVHLKLEAHAESYDALEKTTIYYFDFALNSMLKLKWAVSVLEKSRIVLSLDWGSWILKV